MSEEFLYRKPEWMECSLLETVAKEMGMSLEEVQALSDSLEAKGFLKIHRPVGEPPIYDFTAFALACKRLEEASHG